jgi:hypothetical protein
MATYNPSSNPTFKEQEAAKKAEFLEKYGLSELDKEVVFMAKGPGDSYPLIRGVRHGNIVGPVIDYTNLRLVNVRRSDNGEIVKVRGLLDEETSLLGVRRTIDSLQPQAQQQQQAATQGATKERQAGSEFGEWGGGTKTKRRRKKTKTKRRRKKRKTKRRRKKRKTKRRRKTHSTR